MRKQPKPREFKSGTYINRHQEEITFTEVKANLYLIDGYYKGSIRCGGAPDKGFIDFSGGPLISIGQPMSEFVEGETRVVSQILWEEEGIYLTVSNNKLIRG